MKSPCVVMVLAAFAAMLGSASADVLCRKRKSGVLASRVVCKAKETQVDPAALGLVGPPGPPGAGARWAVVEPDGTIAAQSGGITMVLADVGTYYLNFGSSLAGKTIMVSAACTDIDCAFAGAPAAGLCGGGAGAVTCEPPGTNTDAHVFVSTANPTNDAPESHPFFVAAL